MRFGLHDPFETCACRVISASARHTPGLLTAGSVQHEIAAMSSGHQTIQLVGFTGNKQNLGVLQPDAEPLI